MSQEQRLPEPYYEDSGITIFHGRNEDILPLLAAESFHAVVTDPPYELRFMNSKWDGTGISFQPETWQAVLRVLKPGGHLLSFGGTRTCHRMVCAIEDAGFEIRDTLGWVFASGFPKSLSVSKALDKAAGAEREMIGPGQYADRGRVVGVHLNSFLGAFSASETDVVTAPATDAAKQWDGWGSALKPAWESICLARKPLTGTIVENILEYGCGGLNIDASRIPTDESTRRPMGQLTSKGLPGGGFGAVERLGKRPIVGIGGSDNGRYPSNLIHDGSPEVLAEFDKAGERSSGVHAPHHADNGKDTGIYGAYQGGPRTQSYGGDTGSAARFFFCAKSSRAEREENLGDLTPATGTTRRNTHSTVKPLALMSYLIRLITPPGGILLDPFMGSGSTLVAAQALGFRAVGIEQDEAFCEIAARRLRQRILPFTSPQREEKHPVTPTSQPTLFTDP